MTPITKIKWEGFSEKMKWDCVVALRGPDCNFSETVKMYTTSVIRHRLSKVMRVGGVINDTLDAVCLPRWDRYEDRGTVPKWRRDPGAWNFSHFLEHVGEAAQLLDIPIVWISASVWFEAMEANHYINAGKKMMESLPVGDETGKPLIEWVDQFTKKAWQP